MFYADFVVTSLFVRQILNKDNNTSNWVLQYPHKLVDSVTFYPGNWLASTLNGEPSHPFRGYY